MLGSNVKIPRKARRILGAVALISIFFLAYAYVCVYTQRNVVREFGRIVETGTGTASISIHPDLIIDQPSCKIPRTQIMPEYFKEGGPGAWHVNQKPECSYEKKLAVLEEKVDDAGNKIEILRLVDTESEDDNDEGTADRSRNCCVSEITRRDPFSDHGYKLSTCEPFRPPPWSPMNVTGKAMLLVRCGDRLNFEATLPTNIPAVKAKFEYWRMRTSTGNPNQRTATATPTPISVLLLGIDTVSRSNAFRALPLTLDYMTSKMGFVDFQGFHSAAPDTLTNFMGLLMGLPRDQVRKTCAPDWSSQWDGCPLLWKEFDSAHYVTMFIEDGYQTFNWAGRAGFTKEPTDYYLHPLLGAVGQLRRRHSQSIARKWFQAPKPKLVWEDDNYGNCVSNETGPQFMLRYTQRFVDKFSRNLPFFALTWVAYPYHDDNYAVPTLDKELLQLMEHFNSDSDSSLLDSTLIVFLSDHGDRLSPFSAQASDSYFERALPPLFIRVPAQIRTRLPDYAQALAWNAAHRLVTPFDLHHTLLHLLNLGTSTNPSKSKSEEFGPVLHDRSSLFHRVAGNRTAEQLHLDSDSTVCNVDSNPEPFTHTASPLILSKLMEFVEKKLNQVVAESGYANLCRMWKVGVSAEADAMAMAVLSAFILNKRHDSLDVLLRFKASPFGARFEIKIRVWLNLAETSFEKAELLGDFIRINKYGDQSSCIPTLTDRDKLMKGLCVCSGSAAPNQHPKFSSGKDIFSVSVSFAFVFLITNYVNI